MFKLPHEVVGAEFTILHTVTTPDASRGFSFLKVPDADALYPAVRSVLFGLPLDVESQMAGAISEHVNWTSEMRGDNAAAFSMDITWLDGEVSTLTIVATEPTPAVISPVEEMANTIISIGHERGMVPILALVEPDTFLEIADIIVDGEGEFVSRLFPEGDNHEGEISGSLESLVNDEGTVSIVVGYAPCDDYQRSEVYGAFVSKRDLTVAISDLPDGSVSVDVTGAKYRVYEAINATTDRLNFIGTKPTALLDADDFDAEVDGVDDFETFLNSVFGIAK